jgi:type V secretory pathway adhesin AidA
MEGNRVNRGDQGPGGRAAARRGAHARGIGRRQLLIGGAALGGLAVAGGAIALSGAPVAHASDEYDVLRTRWADLVTGGAIDPGDPAYATVLARLNSTAQQ